MNKGEKPTGPYSPEELNERIGSLFEGTFGCERSTDKARDYANLADDIWSLAAKCVYASDEEKVLDAYYELGSMLNGLGMYNPSFFVRLGKLGKRVDEKALKRKIGSLDEAAIRAYKAEGAKGLAGLFRKTEDRGQQIL